MFHRFEGRSSARTWMYKIAKRIAAGAGRSEDLDVLIENSHNMGMMPGMSICGLPDGAVYPIRTIIQKYRAEFERHIAQQAPNQAAEVITKQVPSAYELPILGQRPPQATWPTAAPSGV